MVAGVLKFAGSYSGNRDRSSDTQAYTSFANGGHDMNRYGMGPLTQ